MPAFASAAAYALLQSGVQDSATAAEPALAVPPYGHADTHGVTTASSANMLSFDHREKFAAADIGTCLGALRR